MSVIMENLGLHVLSILLLMQYCMCGLGMASQTLATDEASLLQFKESVLDPYQVLANNWSTAVSVCDWVGVSCGLRHKRVVALRLSNIGLKGNIPPCIGNLSFLALLNLSSNHFYGQLPTEMEQLQRLSSIDLSRNFLSGTLPMWSGSAWRIKTLSVAFNNFTGTIPHALFNMSRLERLELSYNLFKGTIPNEIGKLHNLKILQLGGNRLSGSIPSTMHNMSSLQLLIMAANELSGHIPSNLGECKNIQILSLSVNKLSGNIPTSLANLTLLRLLVLAENNLEGKIPSSLGTFQNLETVSLGTNGLSGHIPLSIFNASSLRVLSLENNTLSGEIPSNIQLPKLEILLLWKNNLSGIIPSSIGNCSNLRDIELHYNFFSGSIPNTLGNLRLLQWLNIASNSLTTSASHEGNFLSSMSNCKHLSFLDISYNPIGGALQNFIGNLSTSLQTFYAYYCQLKGSIPMEIGNFSNMVRLRLNNNQVTGTIPTTVGQLQRLQGLDLYSNRLQGHIPDSVCQLRSLYILYLGQNMLRGSIPACLSYLTSLRYLDLGSNYLSSTSDLSLWSLKDMLVLNLSSNSFRGILPPEVGNLKVIILLDLSNNLLFGDIPPTLGGLQGLQVFSLSNNRLQGSIPASFGNLLSLTELDLSVNNLSGIIPKSLERISSLKLFNVSFNRLEGEIPTEGPFSKFTAASFSHNYALCGSPRLLVQPCKIRALNERKKTTMHLLRYILPAIGSFVLLGAILVISKKLRKRNASLPATKNLLPLATWRRISRDELLQAADGFSECNLIGKGSFGFVYKGILADGMNVAVKVFNLDVEETFESFEVECEVMRSIRHRNLVKIVSSCCNIDFKALVFQFMPNGSLEKWLYSHNYFLDMLQRLNITIDVALGLEYLHFEHPTPIVHCDLKPSNVLLDEEMVGHLTDFGIAKLLGGDSMTHTMTLATIGYMAPEYGSTGLVSTKGDVYSYGILLMETFTGKKPTDDMFIGERNLRRWVEESLYDGLINVVDANLLRRDEEHPVAQANCVSSVMELALHCTEELPSERKDIRDVATSLKKIKVKFLKDMERA